MLQYFREASHARCMELPEVQRKKARELVTALEE
jgi:hypothetical protein